MIIKINFSSFNCRGLGDWRKREFLIKLLKENNIDICYLQETHCSSKFIGNSWKHELGGNCFWSFGSNRTRGVGIWFRPGLSFKIVSLSRDNDGRMLSLLVKFDETIIRLTAIYAPVINSERNIFFSSFADHLRGQYPIILGGDFNCVIDIQLDKNGGVDSNGESKSRVLKSICDDFNLIDPFRKLNPKKKEFTWRNSLNTILCRLDRFYVSRSISQNVVSVENVNVPYIITDHSLVKMIFNTNTSDGPTLGPGYWKCNVNILKDDYFQADFVSLWERLKEETEKNSAWWETCKGEFKQLLIGHSIRLGMIYKERHKTANWDLQKLLQQSRRPNSPANLQDQIVAAREVIDNLYTERAEGSKIRAKVQHLEKDEKPTRYFLHKEKQSAESKFIKQLTTEAGQVVSTDDEIQEECKTFYQDLYKFEPIDNSLNDYFLQDLPKLNEETTIQCEGPITLEEIKIALGKMSNYNTPGLDGLPKEFYTFAMPYIGETFTNLLNRCWKEEKLPFSQRQGLVTLICKDKSNPDKLKNWRPISLLNVDYKILSKVLTMRLRSILSDIVNTDQTCSIPGRTIQDNVHLIRNLIEYTNGKNMTAAIISLDQSKAFDRVSHVYLFNVLEAFGFGPQFISLVKLLYTDIYSKILVNGFITDSFQVKRSVRQGCSLSPLLYVLCMEPFAHRIRLDPMIKGIPLPGTVEEVKISQYADDTNLFVRDNNSVRKILILVELFELISGAKLNKQKTFGTWLGKWRGRQDQPFGLNWSTEVQKSYGVYLGSEESENMNWEKVLSKFQKTINLFSRRDLSFKGRSIILHTVICNSIWYVGSLVLMPENVELKLNKMMFSFLWNNKTELINRHTLHNNFKDGGLNVVNIRIKLNALLIKHVLKLIKGNESKWTFFARYWIGIQLRKYNSALAALTMPHSETTPTFYSEVLAFFRIFIKECPNYCGTEIITTKFIYNKLFKVNKPKVVMDFPTVDFKSTWANIQCPFVDPRYRDLAWRIAHQALVTQYKLYTFNLSRNSKCNLCNRSIESFSHLFCECRVVTSSWSFVEFLLKELTGCVVNITRKIILFNVFQKHVVPQFNEILLLLVNLLKSCIWKKRNEAKYNKKIVTALGIKSLFLSIVKSRIKADHQRFDEKKFTTYWSRNKSIVNLDGDNIKILLRLHPP